jgi:hypothetical protein
MTALSLSDSPSLSEVFFKGVLRLEGVCGWWFPLARKPGRSFLYFVVDLGVLDKTMQF